MRIISWKHTLILAALLTTAVITSGCGCKKVMDHDSPPVSGERNLTEALKDSLDKIAGEYPGAIGIAIITGAGDTVTVNDEDKYPLMSVFKLHQAISLCDLFKKRGLSLDTMVNINPAQLNPDTWSPMLKDFAGRKLNISVRDLLRYTLIQSDNNASNYLFHRFQDIASADRHIATIIPRDAFRLAVTEADMWADHTKCYDNHSSPSGVAMLIDRLYTDSILHPEYQDFICATLRECRTGADRIVAPLTGKDGVTAGHKTGSGFRNADGTLSAHNDAAFITLPDGRHYTLVVLVKDFNGSEKEASGAIARISSVVYSMMTQHENGAAGH